MDLRLGVRAIAFLWRAGVLVIFGFSMVQNRYVAAENATEVLFPIIQQGRFGFIDATGQIAIPAHFLWASEFSEGRAAIFVCRKYGYIDPSGRIVITPQYDAVGKFSEDRAAVRIGGKFGFIDRNGRMVIPANYDSVFDFSEGHAGVIVNHHEGVIDTSGAWTIQPRFDELVGFSEGLSAARLGNDWGFIDAKGETAIPFQYESASSFSDGRAIVRTNTGETLVIDKSGRLVFRDVNVPWGFNEDLAPAQIGEEDSYRYINVDGRVAIPGPFDGALPFREGLAPVETGGRWGFIGESGKFMIEAKFDKAEPFSHGLANVKIGEKWGTIDESGAFVIQPEFDEILGPPGDFDQVSISKGEWGYIDPQGRVFWRAPQSQRPTYFEHNPLEGLTQQEIEESCTEIQRR